MTGNLGARGGVVITQASRNRIALASREGRRVRFTDDELRRQVVLEAAYKVAQRIGICALNWPDVADQCEVVTSISTARRAFDRRMTDLRRAVAELARDKRNRDLVAEATRLGFLD